MGVNRRTGLKFALGAAATNWLAPAAAQSAQLGQIVRWQDTLLLDGRTLKADALNAQTVIVGFWATWCPFCAKQNPWMNRLHLQANGRYLVLMLSTDTERELVPPYVAARGYQFAVSMARERDHPVFGRRKALPETYVVAPGGKVLFKETGEMFPDDVMRLGRFAT
jgi:thiol-disulfide isomerase/thioredoxin